MIVLGMGGIYHGLVYEATLLVDRVNADLWVVQRNTRGPFAEVSSVPANVENRVLAVPGVAVSRRFVYWTIQREASGRPLRLAIQGLVWPDDTGAWLPLAAGQPSEPGALRNGGRPQPRPPAWRADQAGQGLLHAWSV